MASVACVHAGTRACLCACRHACMSVRMQVRVHARAHARTHACHHVRSFRVNVGMCTHVCMSSHVRSSVCAHTVMPLFHSALLCPCIAVSLSTAILCLLWFSLFLYRANYAAWYRSQSLPQQMVYATAQAINIRLPIGRRWARGCHLCMLHAGRDGASELV